MYKYPEDIALEKECIEMIKNNPNADFKTLKILIMKKIRGTCNPNILSDEMLHNLLNDQ